MNYIKLFL